MTTNLTMLIDLCEADLADSGNATWSAADIETWVRDAIADYSAHFPRTVTAEISCSADDREYDLANTFQEIVSVEYPKDEDPPQFLQRRPHSHPDFWSEDGYYDIVYRADDADADELSISPKPAAGEKIDAIFLAHHDFTSVVATATTVPDEHHYILRKYVMWQALHQLKIVEEASPTSNSSLLMSQYAINVDRARRAYVDSLAKALFATSKSAIVSWNAQVDESKRIY
jgi:hypothetical protein